MGKLAVSGRVFFYLVVGSWVGGSANVLGAEAGSSGSGALPFSPTFGYVATGIFVLAILHTFFASSFMKIAHRLEEEHAERIATRGNAAEQAEMAASRGIVSFKAELFHFLGEIEVVFGLWVIPLFVAMIAFHGWPASVAYVSSRNFTEPLFVFVIMSIAATRPIMSFAESAMSSVARIGGCSVGAWWFAILLVGPVLGSFITEPAAMTISALLLGKQFFALGPSTKLAYATIGLLFVNISIGGTLTHFAAPPVLMVASKWGWDTPFMAAQFGWKALVAIAISNAALWGFFRGEFKRLQSAAPEGESVKRERRIPKRIIGIHLLFLAWTVVMNHHPIFFIGGFLFFIGFTQATAHFQNDLSLKTPLLVGFFLAGLVIHGGLQGWWIEPLLGRLPEVPLFFGAVVLTAFNDNAAITYLATLVPSLTEALKYAVVAGAVVGGGLTVIANAPNPAGVSLLGRYFNGSISPGGLLLGALAPTLIAAACFLLL